MRRPQWDVHAFAFEDPPRPGSGRQATTSAARSVPSSARQPERAAGEPTAAPAARPEVEFEDAYRALCAREGVVAEEQPTGAPHDELVSLDRREYEGLLQRAAWSEDALYEAFFGEPPRC